MGNISLHIAMDHVPPWSSSNLPTSKTMAAVATQAPVLVHNLLQHSRGKPLNASYDGYTSCPLVMGYKQLLLMEFKYDKILKETFSPYYLSQDQPRWAFMVMKQHVRAHVRVLIGDCPAPGWLAHTYTKALALHSQNPTYS